MKIKMLVMGIAVSAALASCAESKKPVEAGYSGEPLDGKAEILRDKHTKEAVLHITADLGKWDVYAGRSVESIDFAAPIASGVGTGEFPLAVPAGERYYFRFVWQAGSAILAETHLPMEGGYNFRDMGGMRNSEGRYVKWGLLFRSDDLAHLTDADLEYLASIPLATIVDFRADDEAEAAPDKNPANLKHPVKLPVNPGNLRELMTESVDKEPSAEGLAAMMQELNRQLVSNPEIVEQYRRFFGYIQSEEYAPLMYHCSAGKDRTGMAAALILSALGVEREAILNDYLASNTYLGDKYAAIVAENPHYEPLMQVRREYIEAGFAAMEEKYGSVQNYLEELGVDTAKMKEMYLY